MYYIGVDLGGTNIAVGIVNSKLEIVDKGSVPTNANRAAELIVKDMAALSESLLKKNGIALSDVAYVGIAAPGSINSEQGIVEHSNNIPFEDFHIAEIFKKYLPVENVYVANDANAAALAEAMAGVAKGTRDSVMITLGTGVGGGIVIGGKIYTGFNGAAGELGHVVIEHNGRQCSCGRRGCWEAYSSATGLSNMTKEKLTECNLKGVPTLLNDEVEQSGGKISARTAFNAMKRGDKAAAAVVDEYISYLATGIANMINIFEPEVLSIGGGVCNEGDALLKPLLEKVHYECYTHAVEGGRQTEIKIAKLGNDAGILGAAVLGL